MIDNLVSDIYDRLKKKEPVSEERMKELGARLAQAVIKHLTPREEKEPRTYLWPTEVGIECDRHIFYRFQKDIEPEELQPWTIIKFMYGDILEEVVLFLAEETPNHTVEGRQDTVEVKDGEKVLIKGRQDAIIDGVKVDVKSAAPRSFLKFKTGALQEEDLFGYIPQLASYSKNHDGGQGFLAIEKSLGHLCYLPIRDSDLPDVAERAKSLLAMVDRGVEPSRKYPDTPDGQSGNRKLGLICSYCPYKYHCWRDANNGKGLRTFIYSAGPRFMTRVEYEPSVPEINEKGDRVDEPSS